MIAILLAFSGLTIDPAVSAAVAKWESAVQEARRSEPPSLASTAERMRFLILLDEVTRQNLWVMNDPALTPAQQHQVGSLIGPKTNEIDTYTTAILKMLLPTSGWFRNSFDGKQITHGAWLIAQHSPDNSFLTYALSQMSKLVKSGDVDAMDYALTYDRVQINAHRPQRYGSQMFCANHRLSLEPVEDEANVDALRNEIGWSKTLAETMGDNEVGKPCVQ